MLSKSINPVIKAFSLIPIVIAKEEFLFLQ